MIFSKKTIPNFFKSLGLAIVSFFQKKQLFANEETILKRKEICHKCEWYASRSDQCLICTCFVKVKIQMHSESCPYKKW